MPMVDSRTRPFVDWLAAHPEHGDVAGADAVAEELFALAAGRPVAAEHSDALIASYRRGFKGPRRTLHASEVAAAVLVWQELGHDEQRSDEVVVTAASAPQPSADSPALAVPLPDSASPSESASGTSTPSSTTAPDPPAASAAVDASARTFELEIDLDQKPQRPKRPRFDLDDSSDLGLQEGSAPGPGASSATADDTSLGPPAAPAPRAEQSSAAVDALATEPQAPVAAPPPVPRQPNAWPGAAPPTITPSPAAARWRWVSMDPGGVGIRLIGKIAGIAIGIVLIVLLITRPSCIVGGKGEPIVGRLVSDHLGLALTFPNDWCHATDLDDDESKDDWERRVSTFYRGADVNDFVAQLTVITWRHDDRAATDEDLRTRGATELMDAVVMRRCGEGTVAGQHAYRCTSMTARMNRRLAALEAYFLAGGAIVFVRLLASLGSMQDNQPPPGVGAPAPGDDGPTPLQPGAPTGELREGGPLAAAELAIVESAAIVDSIVPLP